MDMLFLLGITITKPDRIEDLLPDILLRAWPFTKAFGTRLAKLYVARTAYIEKNARR
jgi:hypothetical protein